MNNAQPEPEIGHIQDLFEMQKDFTPDLIIGLGGGSVLDAAKLLSVLQTNDIKLKDMLGTDNIPKKGISTILIHSMKCPKI